MTDITGTESGETLAGTTGNDQISALGGDDTIKLSTGQDTVDGGDGVDRLSGSVADALGSGAHSYTITANTISDATGALHTSFTNVERITLSDTLSEDVTLDASGFAGTSLTVNLGLGEHMLTGSAASDTFNLSGGFATIDGGAGNDILLASIRNSEAAPITITRSGDLVQIAGNGADLVNARNVETIVVDAPYGYTLFADASQFDLPVIFLGSSYADAVVGGSANDSFQFFGAGSVLAGLGGADTYHLESSAFNDTTILDFSAEDRLDILGPAGASFVGTGAFTGVAGQYRYYTWQEQTFIVADVNGDGYGDNTLTLANGAFNLGEATPGPTFLQITSVLPPLDPAANVITGTPGNDTIESGAGNDTIDGQDGNDLIDGGADNDQINGGAGDDELYGSDGNDTIDGGSGYDWVYGGGGDDTLTGTGGAASPEYIMGGLGSDVITASGGTYSLSGGEGNDGDDNDGGDTITLINGGTNSAIYGDGGDDTIMASGTGRISVQGGGGDDEITIAGFSEGFVYLAGGHDLARLAGGNFIIMLDRGEHTIQPSATTGTGVITISGFAAGEHGDHLDLSIYGPDPFGSGTLVMSYNTPNTYIDHPATGMRYVLENVASVNLTAFNLGVPNPNYAPQGLTLEDPFAWSPDIAWAAELTGADGNDTIRGYGGDDVLFGAGGQDLMLGGLGNDELDGGSGNDTLSGNEGNDQVAGGSGADSLSGNDGNDVLDGGTGNDTMTGGFGNDTYYLDSTGDVVNELLGQGTDTMAVAFSYALTNASAIENLAAIDAAATTAINLTGNAGANALTGNAGANVLNGGGGADTLSGLGGNDWYYVDSGADVVVEAAGGGTDTVFASVSYMLAAGAYVEGLQTTDAASTGAINLTGNELANTVRGNAGVNVLKGGDGNDSLVGYAGDDQLAGGTGIDVTDGGAGNDFHFVDNAGDIVIERAGEGIDTVYTTVSYTLSASAEIEKLSTATQAATDAINLNGSDIANTIVGNAGANTLRGYGGNDWLSGLAGDDQLVGGAGVDTTLGGLGNDMHFVDNAGDVVSEFAGEGSDTVYASVSYTLTAAAEVEVLSAASQAASDALTLNGNGFAQTVIGNAGANTLRGYAGNDWLTGLAGNDQLDGGAGIDTTVGGAGNDYHFVDNAADVVSEFAGEGSDTVYASVSYALGASASVEVLQTRNAAGTEAISLTGNALAQTIVGNAGANVLDGKGGADVLTGAAGADSFAFTTALGAGNVDKITDFSVADDTIRLDDAVFTGLAAGSLTAGAFATGAAATQADDHIIYNSATGALYFDADGSGAGAAVQFATLSTGLALTSADFLVV